MAGWADASQIQVWTREFARHVGQIHVWTRPLGRTVFFLRDVGIVGHHEVCGSNLVHSSNQTCFKFQIICVTTFLFMAHT